MKSYLKIIVFSIFLNAGIAHADDLNKAVKDKAVQKVQDYFNSLKSIEADFDQSDSEGNSRVGRFLLSRPDNMRIEYITPEKEMILLDKDFLIHYNKSLDEVSYVSNEDLPITLLSKRNLDFSKDVRVVKAIEKKEGTTIEIVIQKPKKEEHRVEMFFTKKPFQLSTITVIDKNGGTVSLKLLNARYNESIPASAFEFKNPKFFR